MKSLLLRVFGIISIVCICASCGNNEKENKVSTGVSDSLESPNADTTIDQTAPVAPAPKTDEPRNPPLTNEKEKILSNIDDYLVSRPDLGKAVLQVENTLPDATISKAYAEVAVLDASNKTLRSSYLIIENLRPGDIKSVRIPNVNGGVKISSHIVRIKSDQLTDGEPVSVGIRYAPR